MKIRRANQESAPPKFAFSGAGCVGKTALLEAMGERSPGRYNQLLGEAARPYFEENPDIPAAERYGFYHQSQIQARVMRLEHHTHRLAVEAAAAPYGEVPDYVFTDRSVFDAPVCVASSGDKDRAEELFSRARAWLPGVSEIAYSQIYVLDPADVPYEPDEVRTEGPEVRQLQHEMFLAFFRYHKINFQLLSGTLDERTAQVIAGLPEPTSP